MPSTFVKESPDAITCEDQVPVGMIGKEGRTRGEG